MLKYNGLMGFLLALAVVSGTYYFVHQFRVEQRSPASTGDLAATLMQRVAVSDADHQSLKGANRTLDQARSVVTDSSLTARLIAVLPDHFVKTVDRPEVAPNRVVRTYVVTMVYIGEGQNYAVVDNRFCVEGTRLASGDTVRRIRPGAVLVSMDGLQRWFYVNGAGPRGA